MNRPQTTKDLARRIDPGYVRRRSPVRLLRAFLSFALVALVMGLWFYAGPRMRNAMANPGHVSTAHAMWENNCAVCHDGDGHGGFRAIVSDAACLKCHAGPAHHPNQLLRKGSNSHNPLALAISDSTAGTMRSAHCTACHVEHKSHAALSALDDSNCTKCHADLKPAMASGDSSSFPLNVTAFNTTGGHPVFGRKLLLSDAALPKPPATVDPTLLHDPTHLKFNHATHMTASADPLHGAGDNCTVCHVNRNRGPESVDGSAKIEPYAPGDGRYMRPISFARDCQACHALVLPGGAVLPHVAMDAVQSRLAHLDEFYRDWLDRLPATRRAEVLGDKDAQQWAKESAATLRNNAGDWAGGLEKAKRVMDGAPGLEDAVAAQFSLEAGSAIEPAQAGQDIRVLSAYVAYANAFASRCSKCHEVKEQQTRIALPTNTQPSTTTPEAPPPANTPNTALDSPAAPIRPATALTGSPTAPLTTAPTPNAPPGAPTTPATAATAPNASNEKPAGATTATAPADAPATAPAEAAAPTTQPAGPTEFPLLTTVPTGIPQSPRRWFTASTFDHQAHQNVSCVSCHSRAKASTLTSDVLSPNLAWTTPGGATVSCADCHHPTNAASRGARSSCVTCHKFHDREIPTPPSQPRDVIDVLKEGH